MSFRLRLFAAFFLAVLVPLGALGFGIRREMTARLTAEYQRRVDALAGVLREDLTAQGDAIGARLATAAEALAADGRFRLSVQDQADRRWLLDEAGSAMRLAGLSLLQLQDSTGRILSSGHFRNEYDRVLPGLPRRLALAPRGTALVRAPTAERSFLALARVDSFAVAGRRFTLVGGTTIDSAALARLARDPELSVALATPVDTLRAGAVTGAGGDRVVAELAVPYLDAVGGSDSAGTAHLVVTQRLAALVALRRSVDLWFAAGLALTAVLAALLAAALAARVSQPLRELAEKTAAIDLDRLDQDFSSDRPDEIGALSRLLGAMTERIRTSTARLREAERRAATGDLARQVNHDVKNGLVPIRHVLRHLAQVARDEPAALAAVFDERRRTLESSLEYLETLARSYARLTPSAGGATDANTVARDAIAAARPGSAEFRVELANALPPVAADALALRRILENLLGNAIDSFDGLPGTVTVRTALQRRGDHAAATVQIAVADDGRGMTKAELERAFDDFYTTKGGGTGLGLSVVRRLVADLGGTLRVETAPGAGSVFAIELPTASAASGTAGGLA